MTKGDQADWFTHGTEHQELTRCPPELDLIIQWKDFSLPFCDRIMSCVVYKAMIDMIFLSPIQSCFRSWPIGTCKNGKKTGSISKNKVGGGTGEDETWLPL